MGRKRLPMPPPKARAKTWPSELGDIAVRRPSEINIKFPPYINPALTLAPVLTLASAHLSLLPQLLVEIEGYVSETVNMARLSHSLLDGGELPIEEDAEEEEEEAPASGRKGRKRGRKAKANSAEKKPRAPSGYNLFAKAEFERFKEEGVDLKGPNKGNGMKLISEKWKTMEEAEKQEWNGKAARLKADDTDRRNGGGGDDDEDEEDEDESHAEPHRELLTFSGR